MDETIAWLGLDCHSRQCVLAQLDDEGKPVGSWSVPTVHEALVKAVKAIPKAHRRLMLEECELSRWMARLLRPWVERLVVCDPRENHLLSRHHNKRRTRCLHAGAPAASGGVQGGLATGGSTPGRFPARSGGV